MARASASTSVLTLPVPARTPPWTLLPGKTIKTLVPKLAICERIVDLAPSPMATMAITAPTPMMMPSMVRNARSLLRARARSAIRNVINQAFTRSSCHRHLVRLGLSEITAPSREDDLPLGMLGDVRLVGHENNGNTLIAIQVLKQTHDLAAGGGIEIAGGLVGENQ